MRTQTQTALRTLAATPLNSPTTRVIELSTARLLLPTPSPDNPHARTTAPSPLELSFQGRKPVPSKGFNAYELGDLSIRPLAGDTHSTTQSHPNAYPSPQISTPQQICYKRKGKPENTGKTTRTATLRKRGKGNRSYRRQTALKHPDGLDGL
ncbi:hypothetical protein PLEOSDRAFT_1102575 [Pleurotus ostreatus PC15]|uniref:Uncharacterized protein n=1 Tax=Pleurotus ostreatus (strain PC15) TaxID=1137138 RepID=A0A067P6T1_PLEO1|nr:hypothetical protein PLEOSDRAFT_1102575 [Pleurotus ostreatus PC15]